MPDDLTPGLTAFGLYLGAMLLIHIWLAFGVGGLRSTLKISIGDGGNPRMIRAMRGQANFVENAAITLLLLLAMAVMGAPALLIHVMGLTLVVGRVIHGLHFMAEDAPGWQRGGGAMLTVLVQVVGALGLLGHALYRVVL